MGIFRKFFTRKPERRHLTYVVYLVHILEYRDRSLSPTLSSAELDAIRNLRHIIQTQHIGARVMVWCANENARYVEAANALAKRFDTGSVPIASRKIIDAVSSGSATSAGPYLAPSYFGERLRKAAEEDGITTHLIVADGSTIEDILTLTETAMGRTPHFLRAGRPINSYQIKFGSRYRGAPLKRVR